jgi:hypothetical protein
MCRNVILGQSPKDLAFVVAGKVRFFALLRMTVSIFLACDTVSSRMKEGELNEGSVLNDLNDLNDLIIR